MESNNSNQSALFNAVRAASTISEMLLLLVSIVLLILTIISHAAIRSLRSSVAGKMVINITIALLGHHISQLATRIMILLSLFTTVSNARYLIVYLTLQSLSIYCGTALLFLLAAEAINMFMRIVLVFSEIHYYVTKATIIAWITPLFLIGLMSCFTQLLYNAYTSNRITITIPIILALYVPMFISQFITWTVFAVIAIVMCKRGCHKNNILSTELRKNLGILVLLFTFLGLPWLFVLTGAFVIYTGHQGTTLYIISRVIVLIDALQGPALFVIRAARLKEVRQFWRRVLCHVWLNTPQRMTTI